MARYSREDIVSAGIALYRWLRRVELDRDVRAPRSTCNCFSCRTKRAAGMKNEPNEHGGPK